MIPQLVEAWEAKKANIRLCLEETTNRLTYEGLVRLLVVNVGKDIGMDPATLVAKDLDEDYTGDWEFRVGGTLPAGWVVKVAYGSCSGCDSMEAANCSDTRIDDLMLMALHIVQGFREVE